MPLLRPSYKFWQSVPRKRVTTPEVRVFESGHLENLEHLSGWGAVLLILVGVRLGFCPQSSLVQIIPGQVEKHLHLTSMFLDLT